MPIIQYRDLLGYILHTSTQPRISRKQQGICMAHYVLCPEYEGMKHIKECKKCHFFRSHIKFTGVKCNSKKAFEMPMCYDKMKVEYGIENKRKYKIVTATNYRAGNGEN